MVLNICVKFHENISMVLMLQSRPEYVLEMAIFNVQRAIIPKECNPELPFLCSACHLMVLIICVKFQENILNGFEVTERTQVSGKNCHFSMFNGQ